MNLSENIIILEQNSYQFSFVLLGNIANPSKCLAQLYIPYNYTDYGNLSANLLDYNEFIREGIEILQAESFTIENFIKRNNTYKLPHPKFISDRFGYVINIQLQHTKRKFYGTRSKIIGINSFYNTDYLLDIRNEMISHIRQFATADTVVFM